MFCVFLSEPLPYPTVSIHISIPPPAPPLTPPTPRLPLSSLGRLSGSTGSPRSIRISIVVVLVYVVGGAGVLVSVQPGLSPSPCGAHLAGRISAEVARQVSAQDGRPQPAIRVRRAEPPSHPPTAAVSRQVSAGALRVLPQAPGAAS